MSPRHRPGPADPEGRGHAVVIGASLAGLTAAAALSRHLDRVTVVDRDRLPRDAQWRRGTPQSRHAHNLMAAGHLGLERLFPGIGRELRAAGMVSVRMPEDILLMGPGGWIPRFESDMTMMTGTRDVIDAVVRDRLGLDPKVEFMTGHEAVGLRGGRHDTVDGVWVRRRDRAAPGGWAEKELLAAEFVVDASGRSSRAPEWLAELGYGAPAEQVVDARTAYATSVYAPPVGHVADWTCMLLMASPDTPRQGILNPIEGGKWMVSVSASGGDKPPTDHAGLLASLKTLRDPVLHDAVAAATPLGRVYNSGRTENRWRRYDRMRRWPDQFLVMGDAFAAFNPSYGQGMSVAVQCAVLLDQVLHAHGSTVGLSYRLRKAMVAPVTAAWEIATTSDLKYPWAAEVTPPDLRTRIGQWYVGRVASAARTHRAAAEVMVELGQLLVTPTAAFRPRVLAAALRGPAADAPEGPPSSTHGSAPRRRRLAADAPEVWGYGAAPADRPTATPTSSALTTPRTSRPTRGDGTSARREPRREP